MAKTKQMALIEAADRLKRFIGDHYLIEKGDFGHVELASEEAPSTLMIVAAVLAIVFVGGASLLPDAWGSAPRTVAFALIWIIWLYAAYKAISDPDDGFRFYVADVVRRVKDRPLQGGLICDVRLLAEERYGEVPDVIKRFIVEPEAGSHKDISLAVMKIQKTCQFFLTNKESILIDRDFEALCDKNCSNSEVTHG